MFTGLVHQIHSQLPSLEQCEGERGPIWAQHFAHNAYKHMFSEDASLIAKHMSSKDHPRIAKHMFSEDAPCKAKPH